MPKVNKEIFLYLLTLKDIGLNRIFLRIKYEVIRYIDKLIFNYLIKLHRNNFNPELWESKILNNKQFVKSITNFEKYKPSSIEFKLINNKKLLVHPINWNDKFNSRLWKFNLHYFEFIKDVIDIDSPDFNHEISRIEYLIDSWSNFNLLNYGDGWHSYTLSLRIRNWIWAFRFIPILVSKKRLEVLWIQISWLNCHKESHLGGNHYLENLMTLVFASLQFNSIESNKIYYQSLSILEKELDQQILNDGGHEERSASYHLMILERLIETAALIQIVKNNRPAILVEKINIMTKWAIKIRQNGNKYPRFNDSIFNKSLDIDNIIIFSQCYLKQIRPKVKLHRIHSLLISELLTNKCLSLDNDQVTNISIKDNLRLTDLSETGWTLFRPNNKWDIAFKTGVSCPNYLPGHGHSDLLTFDISLEGNNILTETGTSKYQESFVRSLERSGASHNIMQFTDQKNIDFDTFNNWSEPLEVWKSFRSARKPKVISRSFGEDQEGILWARCKFKPYQKFLISQERLIELTMINNKDLEINIEDQVVSSKDIFWKLSFHLNHNQPRSILPYFYNKKEIPSLLYYKWIRSWTSYDFGVRYPSQSLLLFGSFSRGININKLKLILKG
tara:strand:- start:4726 stop:6570 length:1845 start_codon:yes stop_codon:yes gene_type:complete